MADNTYPNASALVTAGLAQVGETPIATFSHARADVNGNPLDGIPAAPTALTDGATITWAVGVSLTAVASVTLAGSRTLVISGAAFIAGWRGILLVTQDGTGSRTLTLSVGGSTGITALKAGPTGAGSNLILLTATASKTDLVELFYNGTNVYSRTTVAIA